MFTNKIYQGILRPLRRGEQKQLQIALTLNVGWAENVFGVYKI